MKLTKPQWDNLVKICRSNGGGVEVSVGYDHHNYGIPTNPAIRKLWDLDLIQGKANHACMVVHTKKGLDLYRTTIHRQIIRSGLR